MHILHYTGRGDGGTNAHYIVQGGRICQVCTQLKILS